jgi:hypothetical protein
MQDEDSCKRCFKIWQSFFKIPFVKLVDDMEDDRDTKTATKLKSQWDEADANLLKIENDEEVPWGDAMTVGQHNRSGYRMSQKYGFMSCTEFFAEFDVEAKTVHSLKIVDRMNEEGSRMLTGVAFRPAPGDEFKFRILESFYECFADEHTVLMAEANRLRTKQAQDIFSGTCKETANTHPAALRLASTPLEIVYRFWFVIRQARLSVCLK